MRNLLFLVLLATSSLYSQSQEPSSVFMQLEQVDEAPVFPDCRTEEFDNCSLEKITSYFLTNLDPQILKSLSPEESNVILKFIIDHKGKIRNARAQSENEELKTEAVKILNSMPDFTPALSNGLPVNVIMNIPVKLESKDPVPPLDSKLYDTRAVVVGCENTSNPEACSQNTLLKGFIISFYDLRISTKGDIITSFVVLNINEEGKVIEVTAEGSNKKLNSAILRWGKKIKDFIPAVKDGRNVSMIYQFPITYSSTN